MAARMNSSTRAQPGRRHRPVRVSTRIAERTCIGCLQGGPKEQLIRLVCGRNGQVCIDLYGKLPGRGAYLCAQRPCVEQALKGRRLSEAFRHDITLPSRDELVGAMASVMAERALGCIRIARKAGRVVSGYTQVRHAMTLVPVACLLVS
jgi:predicted RNA-binding protein YlxR (DUF448 family)